MRQIKIERLLDRIGHLVRARRYVRGKRQEEVAETIGLSRAAMANFEAGRQLIYLDQLLGIADVLRTNLAAFLPFPHTLSNPSAGFPTLQEVEPAPAIKRFLQAVEDAGIANDPPYLILRENEDQEQDSKSPKRRARKKGGGSAK